jgi:hypothetical protein
MKAKEELEKDLSRPYIDPARSAQCADWITEGILEDTESCFKSLREKLDDDDYVEAVEWIERLKKENTQ